MDQETEIDLLEVAKLLWYNWKKIVACAILCAAVGLAAAVVQSRGYTATAKFAVSPLSSASSSSSSSAESYSVAGQPGILLGSDFTMDKTTASQDETVKQYSTFSDSANIAAYAGDVMKNDIVLQPVIDALDLDMTSSELAGCITTDASGKGPILQLNVAGSNAEDALAICNEIASTAPATVTSVTDIRDITVISQPAVSRQASASYARYAGIGALVGIVLMAGVLVMCYLLDTRIRKEEDITTQLHLQVLGVIPAAKEDADNA